MPKDGTGEASMYVGILYILVQGHPSIHLLPTYLPFEIIIHDGLFTDKPDNGPKDDAYIDTYICQRDHSIDKV